MIVFSSVSEDCGLAFEGLFSLFPATALLAFSSAESEDSDYMAALDLAPHCL